MGKHGLFILLFTFTTCILSEASKPQCKFTSTSGFYSHVPSDLPIGDVVFRGSVTPPDAEMRIANVRSDVLRDLDWSDRVVIDQTDLSPGSYLVRLAASLSLPVYPSSLQEANLFITVICNGYAYPLFTVHIDPTNRFSPQFYNEPYVLTLEPNLPVGSVFETPVAAIDWDPRENYKMRFWLEDSHKGFILLEDSPRVTSKKLIPGSDTWPKEQLPTVIRLQVTGTYQLPLTLRLIAQDSSVLARKSTTFINLLQKLPTGQLKQRAMPPTVPRESPTTTTTKSTTTVTTTTSINATMVQTTTTALPEVILDSEVTTATTLALKVSESSPGAITEATASSESPGVLEDPSFAPKTTEGSKTKNQKLISDLKMALNTLIASKKSQTQDFDSESDIDAIAFAAKNSQLNAIETEDTQDQIEAFSGLALPRTASGATRFSQCSLRTSLMENSPNGTEVAKLEVLNWTENTRIRLIDPDDTFVIENDTIVVNDSRLLDRELFSTLELVAELQNANPTVQCTRIRIYIDLDDENDNRPVFEHENYFFHIAEQFPSGRAIGKILAQDIDQGANGQITYHLLTPEVPFQVATQGKWGILMSSAPLNALVSSYNLTLEARDHGEGVAKSARVPVEIFVLGSGSASSGDHKKTNLDKQKLNGVKTVITTTEAPEAVTEDSEVSETLEATENLENVETVTIIVEEEGEEEEENITEIPEATKTSENVTVAPEAITSSRSNSTPIRNELDSEGSEDSRNVGDAKHPEASEDGSVIQPFAFKQPSYSYQALGMEVQENDILGRVEAHPNPEFYAVDREMIGLIKINEMGELLAGKKLNRHTDGPIQFGVSATNGFETARAQVTVFRDANKDVMSTTPRFDQDTYKFEIKENQQPEVIGIVRAFHSALSSSETLRLTYSLISPAEIDELPFEIHQQSGEVSTSRPLDAEQRKVYRFQVRACLTQTICSTSEIQVRTLDANDNSPVLLNRKLEVTVESDVPPGTKIAKLYATDADSGNNSRITFTIHSPENEIFEIDPTTGQITTSQSLSLPLYNLLVDASDNGVPRRSDSAEVTVTVQGTNPSPPAFDQLEYKVTIGAPVRAGQVIGSVRATDPDPGMEGMVTYKLLRADNEDQNKFAINSKTGAISAMSQLDLTDGPIKLFIEASDNGNNLKRRVKTQMSIEIVEMTTLKFLPLPKTVYISTEKAVGSVILRISASSTQDEMIKFRVLQDQSQFVIDGDLLRVANHLVEGESSLSIRAETDTVNVDHQLKIIVMADRDKYPVFPQLTYDFDVSTDGHFPRVVHHFNAKLEKGTLKYTFFPPSAPQGLYLDEKTGELFVTSQFRTTNTKDTIFVVVRAINQEATKYYSDVGVAITPISTTNPTLRFQQPNYNFEVFENLHPSDQIGTVSVTGVPTSEVKFSITPDSGFLGIYPNGTIFLARAINAEEMEDELVQEFTVVAVTSSEGAKARITLAIRDVNEFSPEFDEEDVEMSVDAASSPGTRIGRVMAHDKDVSEKNKLIYRIVGGSGRKLVFIQEDGTIVVGDEKIDKQIDSFDLIVEAVDRSGNHNSIHVTVYVDNTSRPLSSEEPPLFLGQPLVWNVTEGTTQTFELKASGGSQVRFKIIGGDPDGHFDIVHLPEENTARLRITSELDRRSQKTFVLQVEARDERTQLTTVEEIEVEVTSEKNHSPFFSQPEYNAISPTDIPVGQPIITIQATDMDDQDFITYSLQGDNCEELSIDKGVISYQAPVGFRSKGSLVCVVAASDGKHSVDTTLLLRLQEPGDHITSSKPQKNKPPTFGQPEYSFTVNPSAQFSVLGSVVAMDPENDRLELTIEPAEYSNLFRVSPDGRINVLEKLEQPRYSFLVVATDNGDLSAFTNVKVTVPRESANTDSKTMVVKDTEVTIAMRPTTITLGRQVTATTTAPNVPLRFSEPNYNWIAGPNQPVGAIIGQVTVNRDENHRREENINFSLISGEHLAIDPEGRVTVIKPFQDQETITDMVIVTRGNEVMAEARIQVIGVRTTTEFTTTDVMTTEFQKQATKVSTTEAPPIVVQPTTTQPSEEKLTFSQPLYHATATEGSFVSGVELEVQPPLATNYQGPVKYLIEDSQIPFYFNDAGKLVMFKADYEKQSSFLFSILATSSIGQTAHARINVTILDVNDNRPVFKDHLDIIGVLRSKHIGAPIYQLKAEDADDDNNITYDIQDPQEFFSIDEREGMIRVLKDLRGAPEELEVIIVAKDSGIPPMSSEVKLKMELFDSKVPKLPDSVNSLETLKVPTSMIPGSELAHLLAGPLEERIQYQVNNDKNSLFEIDPQGTLRLSRRPLDTEANRYHVISVTAEHPDSGAKDSKELSVFVDGGLGSGTTVTVSPTVGSTRTGTTCQFSHKVYRARINENSPLKSAVIRVQAGCQDPQRKFRYALHVPSNEFEIDSQSGQIYTSANLDRETKSSYFLTVNVIEQNRMMKRQSEAAIENSASKLSSWQSLVVITVLDENDNSPTFLHLLEDSTLSAVIDRNANLMTPVIHLQARDLDISPLNLIFGLEGSGADNFYINQTNGLVQLTKSLKSMDLENFELQATVTDSAHSTKVPLNVYVLSVDTNVVQLTKNSAHSEINPSGLERKLTDALGVDTRILVAQPFVDDNGHSDPAKSHVFVFSLEDPDRKPIRREALKELLMSHTAELHEMDISSVSLLTTSGTGGPQTLLTVVLLIVLVALLIFICALIVFCTKRRSQKSSANVMEGSYMINSVGSGPRPYDVENISRATAQSVLAGRPLPDAHEQRIDMPFDTTEIERDDTTREFSNSVRERPAINEKAINR